MGPQYSCALVMIHIWSHSVNNPVQTSGPVDLKILACSSVAVVPSVFSRSVMVGSASTSLHVYLTWDSFANKRVTTQSTELTKKSEVEHIEIVLVMIILQ